MSVKNFIPTLWAEKIDMALDEWLVFYEGCNHEYEGQLKKAGDSIRIQNVARPTITTTTDGAEITLSGAEKPDVTSVTSIISSTPVTIFIPTISPVFGVTL